VISTPTLSIVVPVYDEVENLRPLWLELDAALRAIGRPAEVIFVDDGSTDGSAEVIRELAASDKRIRLIRFASNSGLTTAFHAGFEAARGEIVATLDADLQNDPADIVTLLGHLDGFDAAVGWRRDRRDTWFKRVSSRVGNAVRNVVSGDRVHDSACSLRVMRRACLSALPPYQGMHRFVPTLLHIAGYRVVEVPVNHRPRRFGRSKFGARNRALRGFVDLLAVCWMMRRQIRYRVAEDTARDGL
jgi:glycosyltransferase involved in cell wall biosynthesis